MSNKHQSVRFGLRAATIDKICTVLAKHQRIEKAVIYGSRAKGNYKPGSDIDLTLYGQNLTRDDLATVMDELDDLLLPYSIDLSLFDELNHAKLREHIERVGLVFYERGDAGGVMKSGWQTKKFGEVLQKTETTNPPQFPEQEFDYIDVSSVSNKTFQIEETQRLKGKDAPSRARRLVKTNDILFATVRPTLQRIAIVPESLNNQVCSTGYFVLRPIETVDYRYLYYSLFTDDFIEQMEKLQKGASYPAVTDAEVRSQILSFPPLPEQQRIVAILDEAFEGIATATANAKKNLANARELFDSMLQSVFSNKGDGWMERQFGDLATFRNGINFTKASKGDTVKILGVKDFQNHFSATLDDLDTVTTEGILPDSDMLKANDILFVRSNGNLELIGRCLLVGEVSERVTFSGFTIRARLNDGSLNARYLCHFFKAKTTRQKMIDGGNGVNIKSLNQTTLSTLAVPLPTYPEQTRIAIMLDELSTETKKLEAIYQQKLVALDELKKSILNQAFSGQLNIKAAA